MALAKLDQAGGKHSRMQLLAALGWSLMYGEGRARGAGLVLASTLELADQLNDKDYRLRALWGLCIDQFNNGEFGKALEFAHRFTESAQQSPDPTDLLRGASSIMRMIAAIAMIGRHGHDDQRR